MIELGLDRDVNPKPTEGETVDFVRAVVEKALPLRLGKVMNRCVRRIGQNVSVNAEDSRGISARDLALHCGSFSRELQDSLRLLNFETVQSASATDPKGIEHIFLTPESNPYDIIIDPTLGQFVIGHNHVFVGTRQKLRDMVFTHASHGRPYTLEAFGSRVGPSELFERMWGTTSGPRETIPTVSWSYLAYTLLGDKINYESDTKRNKSHVIFRSKVN